MGIIGGLVAKLKPLSEIGSGLKSGGGIRSGNVSVSMLSGNATYVSIISEVLRIV